MKKTLFAFLALATAFAATSCQSDEELTQPTGKPMVINAVAEGIGTKTRAEMAYKYDILWSEGDQIIVKGDSESATFTLQSGKGTTEGTFECKGSPFGSGDEVEAYYPATLVKDGSLEWPAEQTSSTVIPMYSKQTLGNAEEENFSFASLGAMLQIVFNSKQENVTLKSITLKDGTNPLSGAFTVDDDGKAVMATNTDAPGITLDLGDGVAVSNKIQYFNIALPAGTYSNLSITFTATDNTVCTMKGSVTLNHNTVGRLTLTGFTPTAGCATADGVGYVKWVQLWAGGPKFAEFNVGATLATEYGGYYTWGGTYKNGKDIAWDGTYNEGPSVLSGADDTATKLWGSNWRMPTSDELEALLYECTCTWTASPAGLLCKGKEGTAYAYNSIFLPAADYCQNGDLFGVGRYGYYWSSTPEDHNNAYFLDFSSYNQNVVGQNRDYGFSVRAVLKE